MIIVSIQLTERRGQMWCSRDVAIITAESVSGHWRCRGNQFLFRSEMKAKDICGGDQHDELIMIVDWHT